MIENTSKQSLQFHESHRGKIAVQSKIPLDNRDDLTLAYTPGVAAPCEAIAKNPEDIYKYTIKGNCVAVITDGSAVLGLGNIGADASLPVMEGKCVLFKRFADIDAFPICINTQDSDEFIETVKRISTSFGGINLEDIASPQCFEIEKRLKEELDIPVFHDDQHGTAITVLAALINAFKITNRTFEGSKIVINGAGAAGISIAELILAFGGKNIILSDRHGALTESREDIQSTPHKMAISKVTNPNKETGDLACIFKNADVFIGVSAPNIVDQSMIKSMAPDSIVFAMANPVPEIMPDEALAAGAKIVGSGRSDCPNQINNVLAFPGVFRGALDKRVKNITKEMYIAAAKGLASLVPDPLPEKIVPDIFDEGVTDAVAKAITNLES